MKIASLLVVLLAFAVAGFPDSSSWNRIDVSPPPTRMITICKQACPISNQFFSFAHTNPSGTLPSVIFPAGECRTFDVTNSDPSNTFTENVPPGWTLSKISCTYSTSAVSFSNLSGGTFHSVFQPGDKSVHIDVNETNVTCTFLNTQNCIAPPVGMVSWWTGDGVAADYVGGTGGTLVGNATYAPGMVAQAFNFTQGYVEVPDNPLHIPAGSFTIDAWIRTTAQAGPYYVVSKYECGNGCGNPNMAYSVYALRVDNMQAQAIMRDSDGSAPGAQTLTGPNVVDGLWHHLAMVRDVAVGRFFLYVDGTLAASTSLTPGTDSPLHNDDNLPDPFYIGASQKANPTYQPSPGIGSMENFFVGMIDEVEYFNRALAPGEVAAIRNAGAGGKCK